MNPFLIEGPASISFSGGRTSAAMLRWVLDAGLQPDVHVLFSNTGKERPETLDFIHECETRWPVQVHWLEYAGSSKEYREVDYASASRNGEPFEALITKRKYLPNPVTRFCTEELKIRVMRNWMLAHGYEHWTNIVGIRADEPRRVAKMKAASESSKERWEIDLPLARAGVTEVDVLSFWKAQPFDLHLKTWEGNCDLCMLKARAKKFRIIQDNPGCEQWWIDREKQVGARFTKNGPDYEGLAKEARSLPQVRIEDAPDEDMVTCFCTD